MTDARKFNTFFSWMHALTLAEEMIVVVGVISFFGGLVLSATLMKVVLLLLSAVLIAYVIIKVGKRRGFFIQEADEEKHSLTSEESNIRMKKLVFDDFQVSGKQYQVDFVDEPEQPQPIFHEQEDMPLEKKETEKTTITVFEFNEFIEAPGAGQNAEEGPRTEFNALIQRVLSVVKDTHFAYTVALFWINREKQQLILEGHNTNSDKFMTNRRLPIGSDVVSQIAVNGKPQIVSFVDELGQNDMLPYYEAIDKVRTFVGVPIFFSGISSQDPVAVLTLDCIEADAYGNETITSLAQIAKLISTLIRSYTSKYDLLLDSEVLRSISRMREQLSIDFGAHSITRSLAEEASRLVPWDYISVILFDDSKKSWVVHNLLNRMNDPYVPLMSELDPQNSMVISVIQTSVPKIIDDLSAASGPRFYQAERCESKGAMVIVPLNSLSRCYGALVVESKDPKTYSDADIKLVQKLAETASWALEILSLTEIMNNYVSLDETTGVSTRKSFMSRLHEEVQRANDFSNDLSLVMISIDRMDDHISRYGREAFDFILQNVGRMIKVSIRPYDVVGRFDFNCFVVLLVNTTSNEASLWAEKIRKNVASNILNIENKSFSVTISVGVAGADDETSDVDLLENTNRVLQKAIEAGGNIIRVY
ncbi:MAG: diguanylate cyclase [Bacteroidetes bacterium]|nr:diguanylate cyclase [Bacteroidota bacterium]